MVPLIPHNMGETKKIEHHGRRVQIRTDESGTSNGGTSFRLTDDFLGSIAVEIEQARERGRTDDDFFKEIKKLEHIATQLAPGATPEEVQAVFGTVFAEHYRFVPPSNPAANGLAHVLTYRNAIAASLAATAGAAVAVTMMHSAIAAHKERAVEDLVRELYADRQAIAADLSTIEGHQQQVYLTTLAETDRFLAEFAPTSDSDPSSTVTPDNYKSVLPRVVFARARLEDVASPLRQEKADRKVRLEVSQITGKADELYRTLQVTAQESEAKEAIERAYQTVQLYRGGSNLDKIQAAHQDLEGLEQHLNSAYSIEIFGAFWARDQKEGTFNYYAKVRAVDSEGREVEMPIRDEIEGTTREVSRWGERVPKSVYDNIAIDKKDNGLIDDASFAKKDRGYLQPAYHKPQLGGQVHSRKGEPIL